MPYIREIIYNGATVKEKCPKCGKEYMCIYTEQTPGFRDTEEKRCPHCKKVLETSMEWEFTTYAIDN